MIALGAIIAAIAPYIPTIVGALVAIYGAITQRVPAPVTDHPVISSVVAGLALIGSHQVTSPFRKK